MIDKIKYTCKNCGWETSIRAEWADIKPKRCMNKKCNTSFVASRESLIIEKPKKPKKKSSSSQSNETKKTKSSSNETNAKQKSRRRPVKQQTKKKGSE